MNDTDGVEESQLIASRLNNGGDEEGKGVGSKCILE